MPSTRSRILEFDGLRAIAILLVLGCHYPGFASLLHGLPEFGWIGVDCFFALSGYLITTILLGLRGRPTPYRTFYARRFIRVLPPYLAVTLFVFIVALRQHWQVLNFIGSQLFFLQAAPQGTRDFVLSVLQHPKFHLAHLAPLLMLAHALPVASFGTDMTCAAAVKTYWSLSIEEYFYLLWAPIVLRCSRRTIACIAASICILEMLMRWMYGSMLAYFSLPCRLDALLFGGLLAMLLERWRREGIPAWSARFLMAVAAVCSLGIAAIFYAIQPVLGREIRISPLLLVFGLPLFSLIVAATMGLLLLRAGSNWWLARLLRSRVLVFIGTISYTMYLVHILCGAAIQQMDRSMHTGWPGLTQAVLASLLTLLLSYASWHWLEKPLLRWKDRRFPGSPHPPEPALS